MTPNFLGFRYEPVKIERLRERIKWMIDHLPHNEDVVMEKPRSTSDVYRAIAQLRRFRVVQDATWRKYLDGSTATSREVVEALQVLYPNMPSDALTCESFDDFESSEKIVEVSTAVLRWTEASETVAADRDELAKIAKNYHAEADATPDFPLITGEGWLTRYPVELKETDPFPKLEFGIQDVDGIKLGGLVGGYVDVKQQMLTGDRRLTNGPTFRLSTINPREDAPGFTFSPGQYYNYINSCEALAAELADAWKNGSNFGPGDLPMRGDPSRIFDLRWRSAFPGVNCLLVLKDYFEGYHSDERLRSRDVFLMHQRGQSTLEAQNTWHVVPAGGHQPVSEDFESDVEQLIWWTSVREFIEELFDKEEAAELRKTGQDYLSLPEVRPFVNQIFRKPKVAKVFYLGIGFDPVTTKPEILVCIVVNWRAVSSMDWREVTGQSFQGLKIVGNYEGEIKFREFTRERLLAEATRPHDKGSVLPAGAACLLRAAEPEIFPVIAAACKGQG